VRVRDKTNPQEEKRLEGAYDEARVEPTGPMYRPAVARTDVPAVPRAAG
jgi:hypothetical protein